MILILENPLLTLLSSHVCCKSLLQQCFGNQCILNYVFVQIRWGTKLLAVAGHSKESVDTVTGGVITLRVYKHILWLYSELDLFSFLCASSSFDCLNVSSNYCVLCVLWVWMQCVLLIHIL